MHEKVFVHNLFTKLKQVFVHNLFTKLKPLLLILSNIFHAKIENPLLNNIHMKGGNVYGLKEIINKTLMFHVEGALLKSSSVFPYFMLVAFEAGGPLRALLLLLSYPFVCLVGEELGLKIMVFLCFFGIKEKSFRIGKAVLPKFFLEDVGYEGFLMVMKGVRNKVGVTDLPRVMVDGFLTDFLGVNSIVGRELKVAGGYFLGLMEAKETNSQTLNQILGSDEKTGSDHQFIGIGCSNKHLDQQLFSKCKEVYLVSETEKQNWQILPREKYPKPFIFHDGRLAFRPTPFATLAAFMWVPFGIFICLFRLIIAELFPFSISIPILSFTGMRTEVTRPPSCFPINILIPTRVEEKRGKLYACNHRTVIDPIYVSLAIMKPVTALTYSISRFTELISPIKTVRLTRNKEIDSKILEKLLCRGEDIVVCPEGTTCREPYLLRFSPLFTELSDEIVPVAINTEVSMFHGTTASGFKFLDPVFFMMNPFLTCSVEVLEKLPRSLTCQGGEKTKFEVANLVQKQIAKTLGFESSGLSRKDKYLFLTGN